MRTSRIYLPLTTKPTEDAVLIEGDKAHYIRNVLRSKVKHTLHFFTPAGIEYRGTIGAINKHSVELINIEALTEQPQASRLKTTLIQGISSSDRMDYSIQKAAELGCHKIIPVLTDFCAHKIPPHKSEKKWQHWQGVAISACEQSGRVDLMQVMPIQSLKAAIADTPKGLFLEPNARHHLSQLPSDLQTTQTVFIGPEGGFSPTELAAFDVAGYWGVQLGPRVLRTETVAPVILGALHSLFGDFRPPTG
ncbi:16S rRNA (uracil(1498)-N(3))-methyltransferase [Marinicella meishanensis]|uniref:16S rRNA (uracil(1498)-N(3))-methyltransferase n=1 Tax=Marinicella meishanensis TaxID=2873263 RepID=UPI001CBEA902|nr:16S rRNA (uracil(1498)-N(3))-methyltransferase [Marinicella sp. NBU2979]